MTHRLLVHGAVLLAAIVFSGCSKPQRGGPRLTTSPVFGIVQVDGQATEMVEVNCHPEGDTSKIKYTVTSMTDKDGKFTLGTYEGGDGLPEGIYTLSFKWIETGFAPKDKFRGAYADPAKSEHKVTIKGDKGEKIDLGIIELKSKK